MHLPFSILHSAFAMFVKCFLRAILLSLCTTLCDPFPIFLPRNSLSTFYIPLAYSIPHIPYYILKYIIRHSLCFVFHIQSPFSTLLTQISLHSAPFIIYTGIYAPHHIPHTSCVISNSILTPALLILSPYAVLPHLLSVLHFPHVIFYLLYVLVHNLQSILHTTFQSLF